MYFDFCNIFTPINYRTNVWPVLAWWNQRTSSIWANQWPVINFGGAQSTGNYYNNGIINFGAANFNTGTYGGVINFGQRTQTQLPTDDIIDFKNESGFDTGTKPINSGTATKPQNKIQKTEKQELSTPVTNPAKKAEAPNQAEQAPIKRVVAQTDSNKEFSELVVDNAAKYMGFNEKDESFKIFSNSTEWCADFVTYVVKETYAQKGLQVPADFGNHRCEILKQWAIANDCMIDVAHAQNKAETIAQNVKPGDILILREGDPKIVSHTGIVTKVNPDGTFETIEGNIPIEGGTDGVGTATYSPDNPFITGFIRLPH